MPYKPNFTITPEIARHLATVEAAKTSLDLLPLPLAVEKRLRREARVRVAHNSTWIENRTLSLDQARLVIEDKADKDPTRAASQAAIELRNYWTALDFIDQAAARPLTEELIRQLHAVIYRGTRGPGRPPTATPYRTGNVQVGRMEYLPPEFGDVPDLMGDFATWLQENEGKLPGPILAAIGAYQFVTIHPFEDGNGRTCRALATLLLKRTGYGLKGMASMESFYAADLPRYYGSLQMGMHHNYYGSNAKGSRSKPDLTPWITYFTEMLARAAEELRQTVEREAKQRVRALAENPLERVPGQVRQILGEIPSLEADFTPTDVATWFGVSAKTARDWLAKWSEEGHFVPSRPDAERIRSYKVSPSLQKEIRDAGLS